MKPSENITLQNKPLNQYSQIPLAYSINDAVAVSGLSRSFFYRKAKEGKLRLIHIGGRTLVDSSSLRSLLGVIPQ